MDNLATSLCELIELRAITHADRPAIIHGDKTLTYSELFADVIAHSRQLKALGVQRGSCVGIHLGKSADEVVATLAIASLGAIFVNINYQWTEIQIRHVVADCGIRLLITDVIKMQMLEPWLEENPFEHILVVEGKNISERIAAWSDIPPGLDDEGIVYSPISNDLAALLYTSGSTGSPKGVMVTHGHLLDGARIVSDYLGLKTSDRILGVPPLNFDYGLNQLMDTLWVGGTLVLPTVAWPTNIISEINQHHVSVLPLVAPSWVQLIQLLIESRVKMPSLRIATNTGGKIPGELLKHVPEVLQGVEFFLMYGLTEAFRSTYLPPALFHTKMGAIGKAIPDNEIFVVDPVRGLCGPNEVGELIHRGCLVSRGYWGRPDLTSERIKSTVHLHHLIGDEPVVHSGDLVRVDEDGILWFEGRRDEMIKCSGFRISPTEVEDIAASIPGIREAVAFGVDESALGQVVHLTVAIEDAELHPDEIIAACRKLMPSYMVPASIHLIGQSLPRTANGKLDRPQIIRESIEQLKQVN